MAHRHSASLVPFGLLVLAVALLVGCSGGASAGVPPTGAPATIDGGPTISSGALEFDSRVLKVPAGGPFSLHYVNEGPLPHNIAIYRDESASDALFVGEAIERGSVTYAVSALDAGTYYFRCDIHPEMDGELIAQSAAEARP